jgi:hypothetical protein
MHPSRPDVKKTSQIKVMGPASRKIPFFLSLTNDG